MVSVAQTGVWDDWRDSTSLGSSLLRLAGVGLTGLGAVRRKEQADALERSDRLAHEKRMSDQFDKEFGLRAREVGVKERDAAPGWWEDEEGNFVSGPPTEPIPLPKGGVAKVKELGAAEMAARAAGGAIGDIASRPTPTQQRIDEFSAGAPERDSARDRVLTGPRRRYTTEQVRVLTAQRAAQRSDRNMEADNARADERFAWERDKNRDEAERRKATGRVLVREYGVAPEDADAVAANPSLMERVFAKRAKAEHEAKVDAEERKSFAAALLEINPKAVTVGEDGKPLTKDVLKSKLAAAQRAMFQEDAQTFAREEADAAQAASLARAEFTQGRIDAREYRSRLSAQMAAATSRLERAKAKKIGIQGQAGIWVTDEDGMKRVKPALDAADAAIEKAQKDLESLAEEVARVPDAKPAAPAQATATATPPPENKQAFLTAAQGLTADQQRRLKPAFQSMPASFASEAEADAWFDGATASLDDDLARRVGIEARKRVRK